MSCRGWSTSTWYGSLGDAAEEPRFGQLATVREYALERLAESGEAEATRDRHLAYYLALAEQAEGAMHGPDETRWLNRLDREVDNLRLAHDWAIARGDAEAEWRLVAALALFWVLARLSAGRRRSGWKRRCRARMWPTRRCGRGSSKAPGCSPSGPATTSGRSPTSRRAWPPPRRRETAPWRCMCSAIWGTWCMPGAMWPAPERSSPRCWPWPARSIPGR